MIHDDNEESPALNVTITGRVLCFHIVPMYISH